MAASTNSPKEALNTPVPLVSGTGLSSSSGNSVLSRPTERECTQRRFGQFPKFFLTGTGEPNKLKTRVGAPPVVRVISADSQRISFTPGGTSLGSEACAPPDPPGTER